MSRRSNVVNAGKVHVCARMCKTCIFRPGNLMHLEEGRVDDMVAKATADEGCIPCHSTLDQPQQAVCRGFFDRHATSLLQIAQRLDFIAYIEPPKERA